MRAQLAGAYVVPALSEKGMNVLLTKTSQATGKTHTRHIPLNEGEFIAWRAAGSDAPLIQSAFPELSDDDREFILTGITPEEWDEMFSEDEDEAIDEDEPAF